MMHSTNIRSNRQCDNTINVFEGIHRNWLFMSINVIMISTQVLISFVGGAAFSVVRLTPGQWALSLVVAAISLPLGVLIRLLPDEPFEKLRIAIGRTWKILWPW